MKNETTIETDGVLVFIFKDSMTTKIPIYTAGMPLENLASMICASIEDGDIEMQAKDETIHRAATDLTQMVVERGEESYVIDFSIELKGLKAIPQ